MVNKSNPLFFTDFKKGRHYQLVFFYVCFFIVYKQNRKTFFLFERISFILAAVDLYRRMMMMVNYGINTNCYFYQSSVTTGSLTQARLLKNNHIMTTQKKSTCQAVHTGFS